MTNHNADHNTKPSLQFYARIAGLAYIITIMLGIFAVNIIERKLIVPENNAATFNNIMANEPLFRIGVASEILMYMLVVLLAWALFGILSTVNKNLALLALLFRLAEAVIGSATTVLSGLLPLLLLKGEVALPTEQIHALLGLFLNVRHVGLDVVLIFIGVGGSIFCYLLFKSRYIPRALAAWGILTYISMLIISFASILIPDLPQTAKLIFFAPGGLFELTVGFWLLIKGVNIKPLIHE